MNERREVRPWRRVLLLALVPLSLLATQSPARSAPVTHECGLPDARPVWIEYGEGAVPPEVRVVFSHPGVVVSASGTAIPAAYRGRGAATTFWANLPPLVGEPPEPADPAAVVPAADAAFDRAVTSTGCARPWIALNELIGSSTATPWAPNVATYRENVAVLVERLTARGGRPFLLVPGDPNVTGDAAAWWLRIARSADIVYEAYYNAPRIDRMGTIMGPRRVRMGMRRLIERFTAVGIPRERLGIMLGFQVAVGFAGREGLQPREAWFRFVKWNALSAKQVAVDEGISTLWSWGWGTFGPASTDPDKPVAACTYLWARDPALCDAPTTVGPAFDASLAEGPIALPANVLCSFTGGTVTSAQVERWTAFAGDRQLALDAVFARTVLRQRVPISQKTVANVERAVIKRVFRGSKKAYLATLKRRKATQEIARAVIEDELRRRALGAGALTAALQATQSALTTATCLRDELPGQGDFPFVDDRWVGGVALGSRLRFLFDDRRAPAAPAGLTAVTAPAPPRGVLLDWADAKEPDAGGYLIWRAPSAAGPFTLLTKQPIYASTHTDRSAPLGTTWTYAVRVVDTSGNRSGASVAAAAP